MDALETIDFSNKTTLTIKRVLAGDDVINLNNPNTPTGLTTITVSGGDPTASDKLIVTGTSGNDTIGYNPTGIGIGSVTIAGLPTVNFTTTESVVIDGNGGTDTLTHTTPAGFDVVTYTPGTAPDAGSIHTIRGLTGTEIVPLSFLHIGGSGSVLPSGAGAREDRLQVYGTVNSETFQINGPTDQATINGTGGPVTTTMNTAGISELDLFGLEGDDFFSLNGLLPFGATTVDAGDPSASDAVNLSGASGAVTISLIANSLIPITVTGFGGNVGLVGVETLNASARANSISVVGTFNPDSFNVTPVDSTSATIVPAGYNLTINTVNSGTLTVDGSSGADTVTVNGTQNSETITVTGALVTVGVLKTVNYINSEKLAVYGQSGSDTFNVTPSATTSMFIDGGDLIGVLPGDTLAIAAGGGITFNAGPESDEGGFVITGGATPVSSASTKSKALHRSRARPVRQSTAPTPTMTSRSSHATHRRTSALTECRTLRYP